MATAISNDDESGIASSQRRKPLVVYWNNNPSPYMVDRFNAFAKDETIEFEVWLNDRIEPGRSWVVDESSWNFGYRYLPTFSLLGKTFHIPWFVLRRRPDVMFCLHAAPSFVFGWAVAKLRGVKTGFRVLTTFDRWVSRSYFKESVKHILFRLVDAIETTGSDGKKFARRYGTPENRIHYATHTINVSELRSASSNFGPRREAERNELGLSGTIFLYVGRLWWGKGVVFLLEAFGRVQKHAQCEVSLLLVGDGEDEQRLRELCEEKDIRNVVFAGYKQKAELPKYYAISDVFVFPTLGDPYGLVVDEAMCCGLPVVSTEAAGDIRDRIEDGINGYIVPPEDSEALADRMGVLACDRALRRSMGRVSIEKVATHTPEVWASDFRQIVDSLLSREDTLAEP